MIVKHIPIRTLSKSSFSGLVNYITNAMDRNERVGEIRITNCESDHPTWAAMEVESVQLQNTRSMVDKTYHLLVSFRQSEQPSPDVLRNIEDKLCLSLGYQDHQRVSAVHHDTDHVHMHIAINKVHPLKLTTLQPYNDYKIFAAQCIKLEKEHKLAIDNHIPHRTAGEAKAHDMEMAAGVESLIGWVKRECLPELQAVSSWEELHRALAHNGLNIEQRGNGLVIKDKQGIAIKASSLERSFSSSALEKRLGIFQPAIKQELKITKSYEIKPMASKIDTKQLWAHYQHDKVQHKQRQQVLSARATERKERRLEIAKKSADTKRIALTLAKGELAKKVLHHGISQSYLKDVKAIQMDYRADQQKIYDKGRPLVWYDWLKAKAWEGNTQALDVLRHRYDHGLVRGNSITHEGIDRVNYLAGAKIELVTKRGTVHYQVAQTVLRDNGKELRLANHISNQVVEAALKLGMQRFGNALAINGTDEFRKQVLDVTVAKKLNITFTDPMLEAQKKLQLTPKITPSLSKEDAAGRYIDERNQKRDRGIEDIMPHRRFTEGDAGKHSFAGLREIEGHTLMLLKTPTETLVLPIEDKTIARTQRMEIGKMIDVDSLGIVRGLGLGRKM